jgi:hypothetical protein
MRERWGILCAMSSPLAGAFTKLRRAEKHLAAVKQAMTRWRTKQPGMMAMEKNDEGTEFSLYTQFRNAPNLASWGCMIGDCVHSLRSALDHVVYELSGPEPPARVEFPILADKFYFDLPISDSRSYLYKIRGVKSDAVRAIIEREQPFQLTRTERAVDHHLWVIHELDNQDKHRLLIPVGTRTMSVNFDVRAKYIDTPPPDRPPITLTGPESFPLENHAHVLTIRLPYPAARVEMQGAVGFGIGISLGDRSGSIPEVLGNLCQYSRGLLKELRDALV